jgi:Tol biopolymer transport system component
MRGQVFRGVLVGMVLVSGVLAAARAAATSATAGATSTTPSFAPDSSVRLASIGDDGMAATSGTTAIAVSADAQSAVFATSARLRTEHLIGSGPASGEGSAIYVRNPATSAITLLTDPTTTGYDPSVSDNGRLVAYDDASSDSVVVVDRRFTGQHALDAPGNLSAQPASDTAADLPLERMSGCTSSQHSQGDTSCGPVLSGDGKTLAFAATLDPSSPQLGLTVDANPDGQAASTATDAVGNILDLSGSYVTGTGYYVQSEGIEDGAFTFTNSSERPVALTGMQVAPPNGDAAPVPLAGFCETTLAPQANCSAAVSFDYASCPQATTHGPALLTAQVSTASATPDGQTSALYSVVCTEPVSTGTAPTAPIEPSCPPVPAGLDLRAAPQPQADNIGTPVEDTGPAEIGRPYVTWQVVTPPAAGSLDANATLEFLPSNGTDCGLQLIDPTASHVSGQPPAGSPPPCRNGEVLRDPEALDRILFGETATSCTAYVLVRPQAVALDDALLGVAYYPNAINPNTQVLAPTAMFSTRGVQSDVIVRRDPTGTGNFENSTSVVVNVDGKGAILPAASQPALSSDGRYVAFAAPIPFGDTGAQRAPGESQVWRHDTATTSAGKPGPTVMVSCLPAAVGTPCTSPTDAGTPATSADGNTVAFATFDPSGKTTQQVYVTDVDAEHSMLLSASKLGAGGDAASWAPAISGDGSVVAFVSTATNLAAPATPTGAANLYLANTTSGTVRLAARLPAGDRLSSPSIDAHGGLVAFGTDVPLVTGAPTAPVSGDPAPVSGYLFDRHSDLVALPAALVVGKAMLGTPNVTTFQVTNRGPGPATVHTVSASGPITLGPETCTGAVLLAGDSCTVTAIVTPLTIGLITGAVSLVATDDGEPATTMTVPVTGAVVSPTLTVSPRIAVPGEVVHVTGTGFAPGSTITIGTDTAGAGPRATRPVVGSLGGFTISLLVTPNGTAGPCTLVATATRSVPLATARFIVDDDDQPPFPP